MPFSTLFGAKSRSVTLAGRRFSYVWSASGWNRHTVLLASATTCRSVTATLGYSALVSSAPVAQTATLVVLQRSGQHAMNVRSGSTGQTTAGVTTGALEIAVENAPGAAFGGGFATCRTRNGHPAAPNRHKRHRRHGALARVSSVAITHHTLPGYVLSPTCRQADYSCVSSTGYTPGSASPAQQAQWWYKDFYAAGSANGAGRHNCTTYAAFRLYQNGITTDPGALGNAYQWASNGARIPGVTVDQTPSVGSIAQWNGTQADPVDTGHVGYVENVTADSITVSSDSFTRDGDHGHTSVFKIPRNSAGMPDNFIHFPYTQGASTTALTPDQRAGLGYVGYIVQWDGDTKPQKTAWYVSMTIVPPRTYATPTRHWIKDIDTYWCLIKQRGARLYPHPLPSGVLDHQIPDEIGAAGWVGCDTRATGTGGDPGGLTVAASEQTGHFGAPTFASFHTAGSPGPRIPAGTFVAVSCKILDGNIASSRPDGYWYRIVADPWGGNYYAPANVFMNGDPWNGPYSHNTDFNIPDCGATSGAGPAGGAAASGPTVVNTWLEQQGHHGSSTFSDYHSAGGPGPGVQAGEYVHVACKVLDGTIASTKPDGYWYQLADPPWNGAYYVPANTFMNGDPWNGPYSHNTDFNVPDCGQTPVTKSGTPPSGPPPGEATTVEQEGHNGVHTFSNYHNASGAGPNIGPAATVHVSCKVLDGTITSTNPDGYWYRLADAPWSDGYYAPANTFMNGDPWNGPYTHNTDFNVPNCSDASPTPPAPPPATPGTVTETVGGVTHTWTNYANAGGTQGASIQTGQTVQVACKVQGFRVADGDTWWYRIQSSPWNGTYYASADAFYNNGQTSGSLIGTPFVDGNVPDCGGGGSNPPPPPPTWGETVGGVTHTWTNYANAGGTQGASIQTGQTVQVACKVQGFRVADGDTWWYRIQSSPWNGTYYASADAFYNNGQTSGSLIGTPFVDNSVAGC